MVSVSASGLAFSQQHASAFLQAVGDLQDLPPAISPVWASWPVSGQKLWVDCSHGYRPPWDPCRYVTSSVCRTVSFLQRDPGLSWSQIKGPWLWWREVTWATAYTSISLFLRLVLPYEGSCQPRPLSASTCPVATARCWEPQRDSSVPAAAASGL